MDDLLVKHANNVALHLFATKFNDRRKWFMYLAEFLYVCMYVSKTFHFKFVLKNTYVTSVQIAKVSWQFQTDGK